MTSTIRPPRLGALALLLVGASGCSSNQVEGAAGGAATGALAGAAAGAVSALIFGGDVGEAAARGAVWSGTAGAVGGAIAGTAQDQMEAQQAQIEAQRELAALRARIGDDAFEGLGALAECKHEVALAYARTASRSANPAYAEAGAWLEALTFVDAGDPASADTVYPVIVERDAETSSVEEAAARTRDALETIRDFREKEGLPRTCG